MFGVLPTGRVEENEEDSEARQGCDRDGCIRLCPRHHPGEEAAGDAEGGGDVGAGGDHRGEEDSDRVLGLAMPYL